MQRAWGGIRSTQLFGIGRPNLRIGPTRFYEAIRNCPRLTRCNPSSEICFSSRFLMSTTCLAIGPTYMCPRSHAGLRLEARNPRDPHLGAFEVNHRRPMPERIEGILPNMFLPATCGSEDTLRLGGCVTSALYSLQIPSSMRTTHLYRLFHNSLSWMP